MFKDNYTINFVTTAHHTTDNRGTRLDIETNGPVHSKHSEEEEKFLGSGYYFWDNSMDLGHFWGKTHYKRKYRIYEGEIKLSDKGNKLLDLVGRREHQIAFEKLKKCIISIDPKRKSWGIGNIIELLRLMDLDHDYKGIFDFSASRALEIVENPKGGMKFVSYRSNKTDLKPRIVICLYFLKGDMLNNFRCVFSVDKYK